VEKRDLYIKFIDTKTNVLFKTTNKKMRK